MQGHPPGIPRSPTQYMPFPARKQCGSAQPSQPSCMQRLPLPASNTGTYQPFPCPKPSQAQCIFTSAAKQGHPSPSPRQTAPRAGSMEASPCFPPPSHPAHSTFPRLPQSGDHPSPSPHQAAPGTGQCRSTPAFHHPSHPAHSAFPRLLQSGGTLAHPRTKLPCAQGNVEAPPAFHRPSHPAHSAFPRLPQSRNHPSPSPAPNCPAHSTFPRLLQSGDTLAHPPHQAALRTGQCGSTPRLPPSQPPLAQRFPASIAKRGSS